MDCVDQLQEINNLKCMLITSLSNIADICPNLGIDSQTPKSLIQMLDEAFGSINLTSDHEKQISLFRNFVSTDFQQIIKWKNEVYPIFEQNAHDIKTNTIKAFQKNLQINDEINQKFAELNSFDNPFQNIDNLFNFQNFVESLPIKGPFPFIEPIYQQVNTYTTFFTFLKTINSIEKYKSEDKTEIVENNDNTLDETKDQTSENQPKTNLSNERPQPFSKLQDWSVVKTGTKTFLHNKDSTTDTERKHHGLLSLSGLSMLQGGPKNKKIGFNNKKNIVPNEQNESTQINKKCVNMKPLNINNQTNIEDPDKDFVNEYNAFVAKIEENESKTTMTAEERIQARIRQKLMILEHESQILQDNLFIVTKQKEEMIQTYEKHIKEIEKQNQKLFEENQILKQKNSNRLKEKG